jgi:hypothetical protein
LFCIFFVFFYLKFAFYSPSSSVVLFFFLALFVIFRHVFLRRIMVPGGTHDEPRQKSRLPRLRGSFRSESTQRSPPELLLGTGLSKCLENGESAAVDGQARKPELPPWSAGGGPGARLAERPSGVPRTAKGAEITCVTRSLPIATACI